MVRRPWFAMLGALLLPATLVSASCVSPGTEQAKSPRTNYVATCKFYCSGGYGLTTSGSGTSPAAARTGAENSAIFQGCTVTSYGDCTISP
jgi:hypothetical protein